MSEDAKSAPQQTHTVISAGPGGAIEFGSGHRSDAPIQAEVKQYRVLARKYRPQTFAELIGQEAMVRTLSNAIATGRIAHAFILTGVRGIGKTTTARIIARALNCVGHDGLGGPTIEPCGACVHCRSITEDRHVDVIEMDAASRTGVDDIRELTEGVRYRAVSARYKVYIIDEVHMLSKNAFNALLKTLEEPPPSVIFVFATTEIQKVPVTVLSRCQRFSLRRVPADLLIEHYRRVAEAEQTQAEPGALALIARAADGSVRDGLSLLDQAIALTEGRITETAVREMLGIADRGLVLDLLESVLRGDAAAALGQLDRLYQEGADPLLVLQDLLDLGHFLTRLKLVPEAGAGDPIAEGDRLRLGPLAEQMKMPALTLVWQMLLKGIGEVQIAPSPIQAAEMVLIRLAYIADLPTPAELVRALDDSRSAGESQSGLAPIPQPSGASSRDVPIPQPLATSSRDVMARDVMARDATSSNATALGATAAARPGPAMVGSALRVPVEAVETAKAIAVPTSALPHSAGFEPMPQSFAEVVALFDRRREALFRVHLWSHLHLVNFEPGRIEFRPDASAPRDLANRLGQMLGEWTGTRWLIAVSEAEGEPTLQQQQERSDSVRRDEIVGHPLVKAVFKTFPGATIAAIRERFAGGDEGTADEPGVEED